MFGEVVDRRWGLRQTPRQVDGRKHAGGPPSFLSSFSHLFFSSSQGGGVVVGGEGGERRSWRGSGEVIFGGEGGGPAFEDGNGVVEEDVGGSSGGGVGADGDVVPEGRLIGGDEEVVGLAMSHDDYVDGVGFRSGRRPRFGGFEGASVCKGDGVGDDDEAVVELCRGFDKFGEFVVSFRFRVRWAFHHCIRSQSL
ncbi:hypothetical protein Scep_026838 [Stephania cephalantha]|uniref:Uncharacterized protein n=1 Tax=Stephania cephalantha TaxID=152367 RepID=A0AAP0HQU5_9MAGN